MQEGRDGEITQDAISREGSWRWSPRCGQRHQGACCLSGGGLWHCSRSFLVSPPRKRAYSKEAVYSDKLQHYSTGRGEQDRGEGSGWLCGVVVLPVGREKSEQWGRIQGMEEDAVKAPKGKKRQTDHKGAKQQLQVVIVTQPSAPAQTWHTRLTAVCIVSTGKPHLHPPEEVSQVDLLPFRGLGAWDK